MENWGTIEKTSDEYDQECWEDLIDARATLTRKGMPLDTNWPQVEIGKVLTVAASALLRIADALEAIAASNNAVHLTPAAGGSRDDNDTEPQAQVTADR